MITATIMYRSAGVAGLEEEHAQEVYLHKLPSIGETIELAPTLQAEETIPLRVEEICHQIRPSVKANESYQKVVIKCSKRNQFDLMGLV